MEIIIAGADFSAKNLGSIKYSSQVLKKMGIASGNAVYTPFKNFLDGFEAAGFLNDFKKAYLFGGGQIADAVEIINGKSEDAIIFANDSPGAHTQNGYQVASGTGSTYRAGTFPIVETNLNNMHVACYTNSAETNTGVDKSLFGFRNNVSPNSYKVYFSLYGSAGDWKPTGSISLQNESSKGAIAVDSGTMGLCSIWRVASTVYCFINGSQIFQTNQSMPVISGGINTKMAVGSNYRESSVAVVVTSDARQRFIGYGNSAWDSAKEATLKGLLDTLEAAI